MIFAATVASGQLVSAPIQLDRPDLGLVVHCPSGAATQVSIDAAFPTGNETVNSGHFSWGPLMNPGSPPYTTVISGTAGIAVVACPASWVRVRQSAATSAPRSYCLAGVRVTG